ncbi:alpha-1,3-mannosyl-glycoprotein 4-beta-N-acetylglucosaminyltransferase B-like isoform X2 [Physella acuta]|uniref:alpha-1,3-mannosyl-glycoprotein 4-beta-N-acetylglucosaminyltransferase B-like isoform X2 n=1 Tax=Physella acuta TaxID=109671 RepID=UPI0027DD2449|nr:alpha-1,3-mannosyl-glycoprotein 4-beta-N-acetylglucosaminyltransferase B-like isoform X2 [Physella acuta]
MSTAGKCQLPVNVNCRMDTRQTVSKKQGKQTPVTLTPTMYTPPSFNYSSRYWSAMYQDITNISISVPPMPGVHSYLPHLKANPDNILPEFLLSKGRQNVSFVIGIPSIKRPIDMYLFNTLKSLINGLNETERGETLLIVCITEPADVAYERGVIEEIRRRFPLEVSEGLLEVMTPRASFYPDLGRLKPSLGDSPTRVRWRSKQNLDYAFLMFHAWHRGRYYLQLEDDIQASPGYVNSMKQAIAENYGDWFLLQFSTLGFIGRLFKSEDVPKVMEFLLMFFSQKPCDWLLGDFLHVRMCSHGDKWSLCLHKIQSVARPITPSLFQHEGFHSSLEGTINKLKDSGFGVNVSQPSHNPPLSVVITTLQTYLDKDIYTAYNGDGIFWASSPKIGDVIDFVFDQPANLHRIVITSGNADHEGDILRDASIEVLPEKQLDRNMTQGPRSFSDQERLANKKRANYLPQLDPEYDTFYTLGACDYNGSIDVQVPQQLGRIWIVRIVFHSSSPTWLIINKIEMRVGKH